MWQKTGQNWEWNGSVFLFFYGKEEKKKWDEIKKMLKISHRNRSPTTHNSLHTMMDKKYTDDTQQHIISVLIYAENISRDSLSFGEELERVAIFFLILLSGL